MSFQSASLTKNIVVQLVQINQHFMQMLYLPYAAGLLQAYVMRHSSNPSRYTFLPPLFQRIPLEKSKSQAILADIIGFSTYAWNFNYSLELARNIKNLKPQTLIIFGGPHIPDQAESLLRKNPFIDVVSHGEGEKIFLNLLERFPGNHWEDVPGISYLDQKGQFHSHPRPDRIQNLDEIPSPYLLNLFAPLLKQNAGTHWIGLWETNRGCPFSCSYCDWGAAIAAKVTRFGLERLKLEAEWFGKNGIQLVYCCDANYGMLKRDIEITDTIVEVSQKYHKPLKFYIQNAKNVTERAYQIQKKISQAGLNQAVTLSLQTVTPQVLSNIQRENISHQSYHDLQQRFRADGIDTYTDMLIGLPGETFESFLKGLEQVILEGQYHLIRFYNVSLLPNAEMAKPEYRKKHGLQTVELLFVEPLNPITQDIPEFQEIIIATQSLPLDQWRRVRTLAWWSELVFFNRKILQLPIVLLHRFGISYSETLEFFLDGIWPETVIWSQIRKFFNQRSIEIQQGAPELCASKIIGRGEIWLTVEEHLITGLSQAQAWPQFFLESKMILESLIKLKQVTLPEKMLDEALALAACMLQAIITDAAFELPLHSNLWQIYQGELTNQPVATQPWQGIAYRDWKGHPYHNLKLKETKPGVK